MSSYADTLEALSKAATARPWYPKPNDLIGGWAVMNCDRSPANADFGKGDLEVADFTDAPHARFIASLANHADDFVRLLRAAEETREQLLRDFAIKCRCDFVTKLPAGIERCVGCRARDRIAAIDSALAPFEEANRD